MSAGKVVLELLVRRYEETVKKLVEKKQNEIWVSELCQCKLKSEFRRKLWFLEADTPSFILGELVHKGLQYYMLQLLPGEEEVEVEKELEGYLIRGRVDFLTDSEVFEIKYMRASKDNLPLEHHMMQLQLYMWLTERNRGFLIYVTPDGIYEIAVSRTMSDESASFMLRNWPSPRWNWECNYCSFSRFCSKKVSRRD